MPHCQKENHDKRAKSRKERQEKKQAAQARKMALKAAEEEEEDKKKKLSNNIALAEGFGDYEVGCEAEREYQAKFNMNKRSKKHLRMDIRKQQEKKEREEEERRIKEQEETYRREQEKLKLNLNLLEGDHKEEIEEVEEVVEEYLVYICLCCQKKFYTANAFKNHANSKKHKEKANFYEQAGVIVTDVQLRKDFNIDQYDEYESEDEDENKNVYNYNYDGESEEDNLQGENDDDDDDDDDDDEEEYSSEEEEDNAPKKAGGLFSAFGALSESSSSDSDSSDDEDDKDEDSNDDNEEKKQEAYLDNNHDVNVDEPEEYMDDLDLLEEIIFQNRLQEQFYPDDNDGEKANDDNTEAVAFDDSQYDLEDFNAGGNRLVAVQHRLQKRLAAKGIQPNQINPGYQTTDAIDMGKTLLQQVMEASIDTLEQKLAEYKRHKEEFQLLGRDFRFAKGNSKALPSQYTFRIDPSDNKRARANVHHTGSHYHMQCASSMRFGRTKGLMARHSAQGARLQASRMAAKEMQSIHGKGMKIGKTSKKSQQKRRGEAGGSKKTGGMNSTSEK